MIKQIELHLLPNQAADKKMLTMLVSEYLGIEVKRITSYRICKKSIDARHKQVFVNLSITVYVDEDVKELDYEHISYKNVENAQTAIVVGAGPAGLFAALRLLELGIKPIVIERGKDVRSRKRDVANISKTQQIDPESNYSFGEGGAGAYSDGKLYTRSKKKGSIDKILRVFCQHGAPTNILYEAHPHIGTDKLPAVIENIRNTIISCGGEVRFQTKMTALILSGNECKGIIAKDMLTDKEYELLGNVILATGHSARDIYQYLYDKKIAIEAKAYALGVRLEHPSVLIDQIQYHSRNGRGKYLPAAEYNFSTQVNGRGVYSFCMCPGGVVIPAATSNDQVVVNGMSPSHRSTAWSNSGMVVEIRTEDVEGDNPLRMMEYQIQLENTCWLQANRCQTAPAQRMTDFVNNRLSYDLPSSSYQPGLISSPLHFWLPQFIVERLQIAFRNFGQRSHGFLTNEATIIGVETRTSSPIRICRDVSMLNHVQISNLYPCGEGAGYAGGIVSAAIDGERCADIIANKLLAVM